MFVLGIIVGAIITCVAGVFLLVWVSARAYEMGRKDEKEANENAKADTN